MTGTTAEAAAAACVGRCGTNPDLCPGFFVSGGVRAFGRSGGGRERRGFVLQVCSLAGLVAAIWVALRCGATVGGWLRLDPAIAAPGGFVAVFVAALLLVAVGARLLRGIFRFAGFGVPDIVLGIAVAAVKFLLLLSVLFAAFDRFDADRRWVSRETIEASRGYEPVKGLSERVFPLIEAFGERMPEWSAAEEATDPQQEAGR